MKVLVIGAGAIGTLVACRLGAAGNDVAVVLRSRPESTATASLVDTASGQALTAAVKTYPSIGEAMQAFAPELSIVAVKGYDTLSVVREILESNRWQQSTFMTVQIL
jgi:ketopantoate reductase